MKLPGTVLVTIVILLAGNAGLADENAAKVDQAARDQAFIQQMASSVMIGTFTVDGMKDDKPLKEERYEIESVARASDTLWVFTARIKYGNLDTKLPVTVPMEWAGDTPVVTLTNATLPGLGSEFSARVLFYQNRYAGTWQHGQVGGHMFGRIEKKAAASESAVP